MDIAKLKELLAAATPGPWQEYENGSGKFYVGAADGSIVCFMSMDVAESHYHNDSLIVAAVNAMPSLIARVEAAEATHELRMDAAESIINRLEGWDKAYPLDMFPEPTKAEREWLHTTKRGLMDRIAASMGRHMAKCIREDIAGLRAALTVYDQEKARG